MYRFILFWNNFQSWFDFDFYRSTGNRRQKLKWTKLIFVLLLKHFILVYLVHICISYRLDAMSSDKDISKNDAWDNIVIQLISGEIENFKFRNFFFPNGE